MTLNFPGGVKAYAKSACADKEILNISDCRAVCLELERTDDLRLLIPAGAKTARGTPLGISGGTPVYSPIAGEFKGILELDGREHLVVTSDGGDESVRVFEPERRRIEEMSYSDVLNAAKALAVIETRRGIALWKLMEKVKDNCRRVIVDCTETDPSGSAALRICLESPRAVVGGAKILMRALAAPKAVFAAESGKREVFELLSSQVGDGFPATFARIAEKYPCGDRALMQAIFIRDLKKGASAEDDGCLIVSAETSAALYECMAEGMPMLDKTVCVCGEVKDPSVLKVPLGTTVRDLIAFCGGMAETAVTVSNSLLNGKIINGSVNGTVSAVIAVTPQKKPRRGCVRCGKCAGVCPAGLLPYLVNERNNAELKEYCTRCGCCEYICPSGIPLAGMINAGREAET